MQKSVILPLALLASLSACTGQEAGPEATADPTDAPADVAPPKTLESIGAEVASAMNTDVSACDDFYEYACGGWIAANEIPDDKVRLGRSFDAINERNLALQKGIFEAAAATPSDDPNMQKVGAFYATCLDTEAINAAGIKPLEPLFASIDAAANTNDVWMVTADLFMVGADPFFTAGVSADDKDPDNNLTILAQGGLGLPDREYYFKTDDDGKALLAEYEAHIARMLALGGADEATAATRATAIVSLEAKLAGHHKLRTELRDSDASYNKHTRAELLAATPTIPWEAVFERIGYADLQTFNLPAPKFFAELGAIVEGTDLDTAKAYLRWRVLSMAASSLSADVYDEHFAFYNTRLRGQKQQKPRWKQCIQRTNAVMGEIVGQLYVEQAFAGDSKAIATEMILGVERAFEKSLPELPWMDDATRVKAVEKAKAITNKIGYPDKWRDYSGLTVTRDGFFANVLAGSEFTARFWLDMADKPVDKGLWYMSPQMVNAYYNPSNNEIAFPAGILQDPFFDKDFPKSMNFGAMGMVMGHEISHGFDDQGRKYSATGELKEWWSPEVSEKFEAAAQCIDDQYSAFEPVPGHPINGELTLGENIADNGGVKQSFQAYQAWVAEHGAEPEIAGLTGDQLFFVAAGQAWCSKWTEELTLERLETDPHSFPRYRIIGSMQNNPEFGKAFDCKPGDKMMPEDHCTVW